MKQTRKIAVAFALIGGLVFGATGAAPSALAANGCSSEPRAISETVISGICTGSAYNSSIRIRFSCSYSEYTRNVAIGPGTYRFSVKVCADGHQARMIGWSWLIR